MRADGTRRRTSAKLRRMDTYHAQSFDTDVVAERALFELYGRLTPSEKLSLIWELRERADSFARNGIREQYPEANEREVELRLAARKYGRDLMVRAFGWDPERHGW